MSFAALNMEARHSQQQPEVASQTTLQQGLPSDTYFTISLASMVMTCACLFVACFPVPIRVFGSHLLKIEATRSVTPRETKLETYSKRRYALARMPLRTAMHSQGNRLLPPIARGTSQSRVQMLLLRSGMQRQHALQGRDARQPASLQIAHSLHDGHRVLPTSALGLKTASNRVANSEELQAQQQEAFRPQASPPGGRTAQQAQGVPVSAQSPKKQSGRSAGSSRV